MTNEGKMVMVVQRYARLLFITFVGGLVFLQSTCVRVSNISGLPPNDVTHPVHTIPSRYASVYEELEQILDKFLTRLNTAWDGSKSPVIYSTSLISANSNSGEKLLAPETLQRSIQLLNALQTLGVTGVQIDINFPIFHPRFHRTQEEYQRYLTFYKKLAEEIRRRNLKFSVESQVTLSNTGFSDLPAGQFYKELGHEEYKRARLETLRTIVRELRPDYLSMGQEPDTEKSETGQRFETADAYRDMIAFFSSNLREIAKGTLLGAGIGTWQKSYEDYVNKLAQVPELDFINIHIYPIHNDLFDRAIKIADLAHRYEKRVVVGEAWLYKLGRREAREANKGEVLSRDIFSFWEPLDKKFLEGLVKLAHYKKVDYISPFWSTNFFGVVEYTKETAGVGPLARLSLGRREAYKNLHVGRLTETGKFYRQLIANYKIGPE